MRTFIGIDFNKELKDQITGIQNQIKKYAPKGRWKYIDNFHLTLKFLDETDEKTVSAIDKVLNDIVKNQNKFNLEISKIGSFKGGKFLSNVLKPLEGQEYFRVLWLGFTGQIDILNKLQKSIENSLETIGIEKEDRSYSPHLTIAQDVLLETNLSAIENQIDLKTLDKTLIDRIYLFKSEQIGKNRVYTKIREYIFKE